MIETATEYNVFRDNGENFDICSAKGSFFLENNNGFNNEKWREDNNENHFNFVLDKISITTRTKIKVL